MNYAVEEHRITEHLASEMTSGDDPVQQKSRAEAGSPGAGAAGPRPGGFGVLQRENPGPAQGLGQKLRAPGKAQNPARLEAAAQTAGFCGHREPLRAALNACTTLQPSGWRSRTHGHRDTRTRASRQRLSLLPGTAPAPPCLSPSPPGAGRTRAVPAEPGAGGARP